MQSIGMTNRQLRKMMISESFSYVLLAGIVGTLVAATLGMTLLRAFVENGPTSYDDDIPDNLAACADYADSVFGIGIYRSSCRTPAL